MPDGRETGGKLGGRVPCLVIIRIEIVPPEGEVLDEDDSPKHGCPISQESKEVGQGLVKSVGPDQSHRNNPENVVWSISL